MLTPWIALQEKGCCEGAGRGLVESERSRSPVSGPPWAPPYLADKDKSCELQPGARAFGIMQAIERNLNFIPRAVVSH